MMRAGLVFFAFVSCAELGCGAFGSTSTTGASTDGGQSDGAGPRYVTSVTMPTSPGPNLVLPAPSMSPGDVLFAAVENDGAEFPLPTGWQQIDRGSYGCGGGPYVLWAYYVADGHEPQAWIFGAPPTANATSVTTSGLAVVYRGLSPGGLDGSKTASDGHLPGTVTPASPPSNGDAVIVSVYAEGAPTLSLPPELKPVASYGNFSYFAGVESGQIGSVSIAAPGGDACWVANMIGFRAH
jgi:hypothetical protein